MSILLSFRLRLGVVYGCMQARRVRELARKVIEIHLKKRTQT